VSVAAPRPVPRVRSALFIPGSRSDFLAKADQRGADAVLVDLEDSVVAGRIDAARAFVSEWIRGRPSPTDPVVCVRLHAPEDGELDADLDAVVHPQLTAVLVPKVTHEDQVVEVAEALAFHEGRRGMPRGEVRIWPLVETAAAVQRADRIAAASSRVAFMGGGTSRQGDIARALGFRWSAAGLETLYLRSKVLVDVRAAGVRNPISGLVSSLDGDADLTAFAEQSRALGYEGLMCIHPSQVAVVNRVFSPTDGGRMIDRANIETIYAMGLVEEGP
jgi:citrate lyase subunit beta/citryl-CoA lyase